MRRLLLVVGVMVGCSRGEPRAPAPAPQAAETAVPTETAAAVAETTPTPEHLETNVVEVQVVTPTPVDVGSIPNFDRPADPTPASPRERRARCLTYTVDRETFGESGRVKIRVKNSCGFSIPPEESGFEITATPSNGLGLVGHATGAFQTTIGPHSNNVETYIDVDCPADVHAGCKYFVEPQ